MSDDDNETTIRILLLFALSLAVLIWMARESYRMPQPEPYVIHQPLPPL